MQVLRTVLWVVIAIIVGLFMTMNWHKAPVNFWPLGEGKTAHLEWPVGFTALFFFLLGILPTWLTLRASRWRLNRRIHALEDSVRAMTSAQSEAAAEAATEATTEATAEAAPVSPAPVDPDAARTTES